MSPAIDKLEQRIIELGRRIEQLRGENDSFRRAAEAGREQQASGQEAMAELAELKQENQHLRHKLDAVDKHLEYFRYTGMDFVKIQYENKFPHRPEIVNPEDWAGMPRYDKSFYEDAG